MKRSGTTCIHRDYVLRIVYGYVEWSVLRLKGTVFRENVIVIKELLEARKEPAYSNPKM